MAITPPIKALVTANKAELRLENTNPIRKSAPPINPP